MSSNQQSRLSLRTLLVGLMVVPPITVLLASRWLKEQPDGLALLITGVAATLTVLASFALAILHDRQIDEWHRSNARFSSQWGWTSGSALIVLLLALPPIRDLIVSGAELWGGEPHPDQRLVVVTFTFGFVAVVVAQGVCTLLLSIGWAYLKSRSARDSS